MCYSALVWADYRTYVRDFGVKISIKEFYKLFHRRRSNPKMIVPKAIEAWFANPSTDEERAVKAEIDAFNAAEETAYQQELFKQRSRLAVAERKLAEKSTKTALNEQRIATNSIADLKRWIDDLHREELKPQDSRIFPMNYAPVIVMENGERVLKPMRYKCLPAGKSFENEEKFPGTYNARRDSLDRYWKSTFGYSHGIMLATKFYENVKTHRAEGRELRPGEKETNTRLEFAPRGLSLMVVACLWSEWTGPEMPEGLLSFAAITDEPPEEVAAAGHDRCIVPIKPEHIDAWLNPAASSRADLQAILDDRERPYYEHRLAA